MRTGESEFLVEAQEESVARRRKQILVGGIAVIISVALIVILVMIFAVEPTSRRQKMNVIMMVSDGFGPAAATLTRSYSKKSLFIDQYLSGTIRTLSADSLVTDSAAGATSYSCGKHTYNGGIGIDANAVACGTVLEAASSQKKMRTGVVTTTRVTDATPAAYISHASDRDYEDYIAEQILDTIGFKKDLDVILGGGKNFFNPAVRADGKDLLTYAKEHGYNVVETATELDNVKNGKVLGLFADYNMAYAIDRINDETLSNTQPSLLTMTKKALSLLENENGFFVMLEGSLIDVSEHVNDAASCVNEVLGYDETFEYVVQYAKEHGNTIIISTSDHETGGLTLGLQTNFSPEAYPTYAYYPDLLHSFNSSCDMMATRILASDKTIESATQIILAGSNITLTEDEIQIILQFSVMREMSGAIGNAVSKRSLIGWTTHGHTGVDVNLYVYGLPSSFQLKANHENIEIASFIADLLDLDLDELNKDKEISGFPTTPTVATISRRDTDHRHKLH